MLIAKPPPKRSTQNSGTLGKDTINKWIISFLSVGKRGFKSNFDLASIFLLIPPAGASLQLVSIHNSKFKISFAASTLTHPSHYSHCSHNRPCGSHPRWRKLAACAQFKIHNSKFKFPSHYLEHIIGFKNAFLYGG